MLLVSCSPGGMQAGFVIGRQGLQCKGEPFTQHSAADDDVKNRWLQRHCMGHMSQTCLALVQNGEAVQYSPVICALQDDKLPALEASIEHEPQLAGSLTQLIAAYLETNEPDEEVAGLGVAWRCAMYMHFMRGLLGDGFQVSGMMPVCPVHM